MLRKTYTYKHKTTLDTVLYVTHCRPIKHGVWLIKGMIINKDNGIIYESVQFRVNRDQATLWDMVSNF